MTREVAAQRPDPGARMNPHDPDPLVVLEDRMTPAIRAAIDAAIDLAWRPTYNMPGSVGYHERNESAARLRTRLASVHVARDATDELRYLIAAMRRAARCSFANRKGRAYYERKRCIYELRGCLDVWQRAVA